MTSPYENKAVSDWPNITRQLLDQHPLSADEIVSVVRESWSDILQSKIGNYTIGQEIFPKPQIMGFLLNELVALKLSETYPGVWRGEIEKTDKDIVYIPDNRFSFEMKTSSNKSHIYGNRSYAQQTTKSKRTTKDKSGYYLAVNFEKFNDDKSIRPDIGLIRFGWLDHSDWMGQEAATGQQASLSSDIENYKLLTLYSLRK